MLSELPKLESDLLLQRIDERQRCHCASNLGKLNKAIGQFFTPPGVARFMASMLGLLPERIQLLDPGAGAGILTAAVCERVARLKKPRYLEVHAYETDQSVLSTLHESLSQCQDFLHAAGHKMEFHIHPKDFILNGPSSVEFEDLFNSSNKAQYCSDESTVHEDW